MEATNSKTGLLSVIVPVYNLRAYLENCVESLLAQTYAPMEILLVDDGATDGSGEICDAYAAKDARVRVFHRENGGQAVAKNQGIAEAHGDYLAFVDGDDWILPEAYRTVIRAMEANGADVGECAFNYVFAGRSEHTGGNTGSITVFPRAEALRRMALSDPLMIESARKVYRREAIGDARFPEGTLYEEVGFLRSMLSNMHFVAYVDTPFYQYRQQREGSTNASFPETKLHVLAECEAIVSELRAEGLFDAADAMAAFTLDHIMRMFVNAKRCRAKKSVLHQLRRTYRTLYQREKDDPYVRKLRGLLFSVSPDVYAHMSQVLHKRA